MMTIANTAVPYTGKLLREQILRVLIQGENSFFLFFLSFLHLYEKLEGS